MHCAATVLQRLKDSAKTLFQPALKYLLKQEVTVDTGRWRGEFLTHISALHVAKQLSSKLDLFSVYNHIIRNYKLILSCGMIFLEWKFGSHNFP